MSRGGTLVRMSGEDLSWTPARCHNGHPMGPGRMTFSYTLCSCPAGQDGQPPGHHNAYCGVIECRSEHWPPACDGRSAHRLGVELHKRKGTSG